MSTPVKRHPITGPASAPQRAADLSELLGHVTTSWEQERRCLARQLHDSIGSSLTAMSMHLSLLEQQLTPEPAQLGRIAVIKQLLLSVIDNNRQMQLKLWNDKLEFLGVNVALHELALQFEAQHHLTVRCTLPAGEFNCQPPCAIVLLQTLEECLRNVAAHAQASAVDIVLEDSEAALTLTVKDNGVGLRLDDITAKQHGLRLLRERIWALGGSLTLTTAGGATVSATFPKRAAEN